MKNRREKSKFRGILHFPLEKVKKPREKSKYQGKSKIPRKKHFFLLKFLPDELPLREILLYIRTAPPLGNPDLLNNIGHMGYRWIGLDPQGPEMGDKLQISGPDQRGRRRQVPGGPEPVHPQGWIF